MKRYYLLLFFAILCAACNSGSGNFKHQKGNDSTNKTGNKPMPIPDTNSQNTASLPQAPDTSHKGKSDKVTTDWVYKTVDSMIGSFTPAHAKYADSANIANLLVANTMPYNIMSSNDSWIIYAIGALLIGLVLAIIAQYMRIGQLREQLKQRSKNPPSPRPATPDFNPTQLLGDVDKKIMNNNAVQDTINDMQSLKARIEMLEQKLISPNPIPVTPEERPKEKPGPLIETFYMAGPVQGPQYNYFPLTAKSTTKENTVYKFTIINNKNEAAFDLHTSGAPVNEIASMLQSYIKPACDEENLPGNAVRSIRTIKSGRAVLEGDKWIIKEKAQIRYE
jgi:hypothetical protein